MGFIGQPKKCGKKATFLSDFGLHSPTTSATSVAAATITTATCPIAVCAAGVSPATKVCGTV
jgi:hypothetical protein